MNKKMYINGVWEESNSNKELFAPYSSQKIANIPQATEEQVNEAINSAYNSIDTMKKLTALDRSNILKKLASKLKENRVRAAEIIALECAKPLKFALGEIDRTVETYTFAAEEAKRLSGEMIPMEAAKNGVGRIGYTIKEPVGVVAAITPFNFPFNLVAHKVGPAIAAGNPIVLKPASQTPMSALFLAELLENCGMPKGAFNIVTGSGRLIGNEIVQNQKVAMITFTGSPEVGYNLKSNAGLKKTALELGSNAGLIIDQETDLSKIAAACAVGAFSNQGQICISLQRVYVHENVFDEFIKIFKQEVEKLIIGDPLDNNTDISALISEQDGERALSWIEEARSQGAEIITGGKKEGNVLHPTVLTNVDPESKVSCEEVFAPIVLVNSISSIEEGINNINNSKYGLQAAIFTNDIKQAFIATNKLEVGGVIINDTPTYRVDQMPYGGVKQSGDAREGIKFAIDEMTETKLIIWNQNY